MGDEDVSGMIEYERGGIRGKLRQWKEKRAERKREEEEARRDFEAQRKAYYAEERKRAVSTEARRQARAKATADVKKNYGAGTGGGFGSKAMNFIAGTPLASGEFLGLEPKGKKKSGGGFGGVTSAFADIDAALGFGSAPRAPRKKKRKKR